MTKQEFKEQFLELVRWYVDEEVQCHFKFKSDNKFHYFDFICDIEIIETHEDHIHVSLGSVDGYVMLRRLNNTSCAGNGTMEDLINHVIPGIIG